MRSSFLEWSVTHSCFGGGVSIGQTAWRVSWASVVIASSVWSGDHADGGVGAPAQMFSNCFLEMATRSKFIRRTPS